MSTYSSNLKIELIATGDQSGVWGVTTNDNFSNVFEQSIVGRVTVSFSNADVTLTATNTVASQDYRNVYLNCTGTNAASRNLIVPTLNKNYIVENNTTGGFSIVVKTSAGTGITIPNGFKCAVYVNGTDVVQNDNYFPVATVGTLTLTSLTAGSITDSGLTSGRVTFAGASGLLSDSANLTWNGTNLGITGTLSATSNISSTAGGFFSTRASGNSPILDLTQTGVYTWDLINTATTGLFSIRGNTTPALSITSATYNVGIGVTPGGTTRLSVTAASGSLATFQQTGATGYGLTIVPGADTTYDAFTINNAANTLNKIRMFGDGSATFAGNVGIGTSSPAQLLHLNVTSGAVYDLISSGSNNLYLGYENTRAVSVMQSNNPIVFDTGSGYTERMRLDTSGNLGLGVTPSAWAAGRTALEIGGSTTGNIAFNGNATNGYQIWCNSYFNAGSNFYYANGLATNFGSGSGSFFWNIAPNNTSGAGAVATFTRAMTLSDSGNLSLSSITPSAWGSTYKAFQAGGYAAYVGDGNNGYAEILNNAYASNNNIFNYYDTNSAGRYSIQLGVHKWFQAGSGSANAQITFTQAMTLNADGTLGIGSTGAGNKLTVSNAGANGFEVDPLSASGTKTKLLSLNRTTSAYTPFLYDASLHEFQISGGPKMTLDASGNLGIGTTSPSSYVTGLTVAKSTTNGGDIALVKTDSGTTDQGGQSLKFFNYAPAGFGRVSGTKIGSIYFFASQPSSGGIQDAAAIECLAETQTGNSTSSQLAFYTATGATLVKAMTIDSQQNVGISTTNAAAFTIFPSKLVVGSGTGNQQITVYSGTTSEGNIIFADGTSGTQQYMGLLRYDHADNAMKFYVNGGNLGLMINSISDVLIGTSNNTTNGGFIFSPTYNGTGVSAAIFGHSSAGGNGNQYMIFNYNGTGIGSITQNGTTGVLYNVTSDQRLKRNIVDATSGNIDDIKVRSFDWIADGSHQEYGMVAQELLEVAPYAVCNPTNPDEMMGVDYSKLVPMMIKEIQDLKQRIATLENK